MHDRAFATDMHRLHIDIDALSAEQVTKIVDETINQPADIVAKAKAAMGPTE